MSDTVFAFLLILVAGLATGIGGLVVLFSKTTNTKFLSICLSFSAGVMLYVAFGEIFLEAKEALEYGYGDEMGLLIAVVAFFAGILLMVVIDKFIPHNDDITEVLGASSQGESKQFTDSEQKELKRTGLMSAMALAIHNFPEGLITFIALMHDPVMGIAIAIAIIIHNMPEGIATAAPIYYATGSKAKAFFISAGAGLVQLVGAFVAWLLLQNVFEEIDAVFGIAFAAVAGIMVFVAIHQLLPAARKYGKHHLVMTWLFAGMAVMAASLVILEFVL
ncbi:MAG: zinc transporter ZupT [Defluviitaleaceae bacterium]|nr:zinc transporter ZupT [Defluviitaleaceae bacterium]